MGFPNGICDRCHRNTGVTIMSIFNTQNICLDCQAKEKEHPQYAAAKDAERAAVLRGDTNFPGIGKPADL